MAKTSDKKPLVIVESPAKAKTIGKFLGSGYLIEASIGHVRDLPSSAAEIPESVRGEAWSRLGIDIEHDFKPLYVVPRQKREQIKKLRALLKQAGMLYLATDEDREGESPVAPRGRAAAQGADQAPRVPRDHEGESTRPSRTRARSARLVEAQEARRLWTASTATRSRRSSGARSSRGCRRAACRAWRAPHRGPQPSGSRSTGRPIGTSRAASAPRAARSTPRS
jgi:hypothetical protein